MLFVRLQTFPDGYDFFGLPENQVFTQIGNAVPCKLAQAVGEVVQDVLSDEFEDLARTTKATVEAQLELSLP